MQGVQLSVATFFVSREHLCFGRLRARNTQDGLAHTFPITNASKTGISSKVLSRPLVPEKDLGDQRRGSGESPVVETQNPGSNPDSANSYPVPWK